MMPAPVSAFSPLTPFTPASSTHGGGGYFDRPTATLMTVTSPLLRRPALGNTSCSSSNSSRLSRVAASTDSPRQPVENGWRIASRLREEALSAWEQQVKTTTPNITLLRDSWKPPSKLISLDYTQRLGEKSQEKPRSISPDSVKKASFPSRPSPNLNLHVEEFRASSESHLEKYSSFKFPDTSRSVVSLSLNDNKKKANANIVGDLTSSPAKK